MNASVTDAPVIWGKVGMWAESEQKGLSLRHKDKKTVERHFENTIFTLNLKILSLALPVTLSDVKDCENLKAPNPMGEVALMIPIRDLGVGTKLSGLFHLCLFFIAFQFPLAN